MARPLRVYAPGLLHHVFARGNNKQCVFDDDDDHSAFLELLGTTLSRFEVEAAAYCLLWNHYHLLLVPHDETAISRAMQQLNSTYCQRFNRRHGRVGHVLQGRFGSRVIEDGAYARTALRYLALNPVAAGQSRQPEDWPMSSYRAALGLDAAPGARRPFPTRSFMGPLGFASGWRLYSSPISPIETLRMSSASRRDFRSRRSSRDAPITRA
jgi:REP element-mobilizing transposase RayT